MSEIRYLMDENVDPILRSALLRTEPNLTVGQIGGTGFPNFGTLDPAILIWCEENRFILVTKNRHSMPGHLAEHLAGGRHAMAVFILNADLTMRETLDDLLLIASASSAEEYQDRIVYLPAT